MAQKAHPAARAAIASDQKTDSATKNSASPRAGIRSTGRRSARKLSTIAAIAATMPIGHNIVESPDRGASRAKDASTIAGVNINDPS